MKKSTIKRIFQTNSPRKSGVFKSYENDIDNDVNFMFMCFKALPLNSTEKCRIISRFAYRFWKQNGWYKKRTGKSIVWYSNEKRLEQKG